MALKINLFLKFLDFSLEILQNGIDNPYQNRRHIYIYYFAKLILRCKRGLNEHI